MSYINPEATRIDAIWDPYPEHDNLESLTHQRRGTGPRTKIGDGNTRIPKHDWNSGYLRDDKNKTELLQFLSEWLSQENMDGLLLLTTSSTRVLCNRPFDVSHLEPCNHSEAGTGIMLHLAHAASQGHTRDCFRTVDSDVVVLAVHFYVTFVFEELWVCLGTDKKIRDIPVHVIVAELGPSRCTALHMFNAFSGCDLVSHFLGYGKKSAWAAWDSTPALTETLSTLLTDPQLFNIDSAHMQILERFVVVMYSKECGLEKVNSARRHLFTSGKRTLEHLPPTQAALYEHAKRSVLQASFFWAQATKKLADLPLFSE